MSKNVAVFVDVANIFYAAKAAGVDIDYVTLLKSASAGRDLVRAYAYTGLDPDNENQRNFHSFLSRHGYRVVSKDIRKYGDGKVKANLDIELVVDMMKTARNLDIAIVVSGDGDFAPAIRAVQEMGVRVEVVSFRGNTSSDLIDVADQFTDITALAKVEKGSSRSGRRVAEADEDLSMTEVPDKQTEGAGGGRGRGGRGRGGRSRGREEAEPAARSRRPIGEPAAVTSSGAPLVVLPGEKLSRVATGAGPTGTEEYGPAAAVGDELEDPETGGAVAAFGGGPARSSARGAATGTATASPGGDDAADREPIEGDEGDESRRRRRRRGGRGRGRGRGRGEGGEAIDRATPLGAADDEEPYEEPVVEVPRAPRANAFGSVWDSQLGVPSMPSGSAVGPIGDEDDFEEPEIPEYLLAERRNRGRQGPGQRGRGGQRGGRSAYAAAMERERFGGGRGSGGLNRYPDVSARERVVEPRREGRQQRPAGGGAAPPARRGGGGGDEPWSEVPPELEAMLRAQLGSRPQRTQAPATTDEGQPEAPEPPAAVAVGAAGTVVPDAAADADTVLLPDAAAEPGAEPGAAVAVEPAKGAAKPAAEAAVAPAPRRRTTRRPRAADTAAEAGAPVEADAAAEPATSGTSAAPKRRTTRRTKAADTTDATAAAEPADAEVPAAPKRRTTRRKTATTEPAGEVPSGTGESASAGTEATAAGEPAPGAAAAEPASDATPAPRRRTTRRKSGEEAPGG